MSIAPPNTTDSKSIQFIKDLIIPDCFLQTGSTKEVEIILTEENFQEYLDTHQHQDIFFLPGVDPARSMERARDEDILMKHWFYLDFDIRAQQPEVTDDEIKEIGLWLGECLETHKILKSWRYIVFSGNGIHIHYFGDPVAVKSSENWKGGMRFLNGEAKKCTGIDPDAGCINLARLCRPPESYNHKHGHCKQVEILKYQDNSINIGGVEEMGSRIQDSTKKVEPIADVISKGSRNTTLTSIAGSLRRCGLDEDTIVESLRGVNSKKCNPPLLRREVEQIAKSISKYEAPKRCNSVGKPVLIRISDVEPQEVTWLWQDRIPLGKITMLEGDPGNGKSWCSLAVASAVTTGAPLPGEEGKRDPSNVLLLTAEDGIADTLRPRLDTMEGDLTRMNVLTAIRDEKGEEKHLSLVENMPALEEALSEGSYSLVIIDPLNAYLGADLDTHRDAALRSVLSPLARLAEEHHVAVLCVRHLTKSSKDKAIYRGQGSIAYTAAARVVMLVGINPGDKSDRVIACIKNNLAPFPPNLSFEISEGRFLWKGESDVPVDSLLGPETSREKQMPIDEAKDFLMDILSSGAKRALEIKSEATDACIAGRTLKRAKGDLEVESYREGGSDGHWMWKLPLDSKSANSTPVEQWHPLTPAQDDLPF